jgi:DNA mismatch endonuclease (patch repair protein)
VDRVTFHAHIIETGTDSYRLRAARVAVFVDGCFWHSCPEHGTTPKANRDWWIDKLQRNKERDALTDQQLRAQGWQVVRVWEHERPEHAARLIQWVVRERTVRDLSSSAGLITQVRTTRA